MRPHTKAIVFSLTSLLITSNAFALDAPDTANAATSNIIINDKNLTTEEIIQLASRFGGQVYPGNYWYDSKTGAWGVKCGPGQGIAIAGLKLGGTLSEDASCGTTGVFINGRELHVQDLAVLQSLSGYIAPGRYWMDAQLNAGIEGGPALVNYKILAAQLGRAGDNFWSSRFGAGNSNADNSQGYVYVPGHGSVGYGY
jgi:hypothetical protein